MPVKLILWDLDGVLRVWDAEEEVERGCGLPVGSIRRAAFAPDLLAPAITGAVADGEWRLRVARRLGEAHPGTDADGAVRRWSESPGRVNPDVLELLRRTREGRSAGILTNATTRLPDDLHRLGLTAEVDLVINSSWVGVAKPDPAIFAAALRAAGRAAHEVLFVDDSAANVRAAESELGIPGVVFRSADQLRMDLRRRGIPA